MKKNGFVRNKDKSFVKIISGRYACGVDKDWYFIYFKAKDGKIGVAKSREVTRYKTETIVTTVEQFFNLVEQYK